MKLTPVTFHGGPLNGQTRLTNGPLPYEYVIAGSRQYEELWPLCFFTPPPTGASKVDRYVRIPGSKASYQFKQRSMT
jgi:hypothetical protein